MIDFLTIGLILGLSAGLTPGPLLTLVIAESLQHGARAGIKVALAPIISDLPIILLTLLIASKLSGFQQGLGFISLAGGVFILFTGYSCMRTEPLAVSSNPEAPGSLLKGIVANVLNPHPYLFWISVGAPTMSKALKTGIMAVAAFLVTFYLMLVGSKIILAVVAGTSGAFLSGRIYLYTLRVLGLLLLVFAVVLFRDGARLLGWLA